MESQKKEPNLQQDVKLTTKCIIHNRTFDKGSPNKRENNFNFLSSTVSYQPKKQSFFPSNYISQVFNQCSGLDILSAVATQKLKITNEFKGFTNKTDAKPITNKSFDVSQSSVQSNKMFTTNDHVVDIQTKSLTKPIMDEKRVQQLENKVKNINCFDYNKGMFTIPLKIPGHGYKKVKVKRVGNSYLVLFPGESVPRFCNLNAISTHESTSKTSLTSQPSCLKTLFKQKPGEKSLMKEILLRRSKPVSVLN